MIHVLFCLIAVVTMHANTVSASNITEKLQQFINDLNTELNATDKNRMFVITVTRLSSGKTPKIQQEELDNVLNCLSILCTKEDFINILRGDLSSGAADIPPVKNDLKTQIRQIHTDHNMKNCAKIIIFNEMFFAQEKPLSSSEQESIELSLHDLSKKDPSILLCPNFLFLEKAKTVSKTEMDLIANNCEIFSNSGSMQVDEGYDKVFAKKITNTFRVLKQVLISFYLSTNPFAFMMVPH